MLWAVQCVVAGAGSILLQLWIATFLPFRRACLRYPEKSLRVFELIMVFLSPCFAGKGGNVMLMTPDLQNLHEIFFLTNQVICK